MQTGENSASFLHVAASFVAQSQVAESASRPDQRSVDSSLAGAFALWLIVLGLALVGVAVLVP